MNWKNTPIVCLQKLRDALLERLALISTLVLSAIVAPVLLLGVDKSTSQVRTTVREDVPVGLLGLWPLYGIGPTHFIFVQQPNL